MEGPGRAVDVLAAICLSLTLEFLPMRRSLAFASFGLLAALLVAADTPDPAREEAARAKEQLAAMQKLVGQWRGVGQPQRGSTKDSWTEQAGWAWSFADGVSLIGKLPEGKFFRQLTLVPGAETGEYSLTAQPAGDGDAVRYTGKLDASGQLQVSAAEPRDGLPARISFRFVAGGDRLLVLLERPGTAAGQFARIAEVGYTRKGSGFGRGSSQPECIVTGGLGTIEVSHAGKTYYVCCTGCLEYFNDNPAEVVAEYVARKAAEKEKKEGIREGGRG
jgi:hypothetical protein